MNPENETASGRTEAADTAEHNNAEHTPTDRNHQGAGSMRWQVRTTKLSGVTVIFSEYRSENEAAAVAARLCEVGCPAFVADITP